MSDPKSLTERELVELCLKGDESAWADLVGRYQGLIYSVPRRIGLSHEDSADVFQRVCVLLYQRLGAIREPERLGGWLLTTASRESYRVGRRARREVSLELETDEGTRTTPEPRDFAPLADEVSVEIERAQILRSVLAELSERCRTILAEFLRAEADGSYKDIARRLEFRSAVLDERALDASRSSASRFARVESRGKLVTMNFSSPSEALASGRYAFADLGCGSGGSLVHALHRFGASPGLGLELDHELVDEAVRSGLEVLQADLLAVDAPAGCIGFTSMMDFLEHLPDERSAIAVLETFGRASRDFLFIRHPSFENIAYLAARALKVDWTHWTGHPNMMTIADFARVFEALGWHDYAIFPRHRITDSTHARVIPLSAPIDVVTYDESKHGPKPLVHFDRPLYTQFDIFVRLNPTLDEDAWDAILATDRLDDELAARETAGFYSASDSRWHVRPANTGGTALATARFGAPDRSLRPIVGDWDGDGVDGLGLYDPMTSSFFLRDRFGEGHADAAFGFGSPGSIPIAGDWTGSGIDRVGLYMPENGHWFLRNDHASGHADSLFSFGPVGTNWIPVVGDWDGDGMDTVGLYDPQTSVWHLRNSNTTGSADRTFYFGFPGSIPLAGDWNGDGVDSIGIYVPQTGDWHLRNSNTAGTTNVLFTFQVEGGTPVVGKWGSL